LSGFNRFLLEAFLLFRDRAGQNPSLYEVKGAEAYGTQNAMRMVEQEGRPQEGDPGQ